MNFILKYILKLLTVQLIERIVIVLLQHLVNKTESKIDDEVLAVVKQAVESKE